MSKSFKKSGNKRIGDIQITFITFITFITSQKDHARIDINT